MAGDSDQEKRWRRFQKISFDKKQTLKRIRKVEVVSLRHAHKFVLKRWRNVREVRRIVIFWIVAVGCLIAAAGLQLAWDRQSYQVEAGALNSTYAEAAIGPINTLNPLFADTPAEEAVSRLLFSRIFTYDTTGNLNYDLAKKVEVSENKQVYTITLRSDVLWHDGRVLTADDIIFTTDLLKDASTRAQIRGWDTIDISKKGDFIVEFKLKSAYAPFMSALTFPVLPKHILGDVPHESIREHTFSNTPIGSGPFVFRLLQDVESSGERRFVHLSANKDYYRGAPKLARVQILAVPDEAAVLNALKLNEVNGASGLSATAMKTLSQNHRYITVSQPIQGGVYALLNNDSEILADKKVRQALQRATNTEEIRQKLGDNVPALDLPYTDLQLEGDIPKAPDFDLTEAKKMLDEAGWKLDDSGIRMKDGKELRLSVVTTKNEEYQKALETLLGQWRQLGIGIDERVIDAADPTQSFVQSTLQPRAYDVLIYQLMVGRDPDVFAFWHSSQAVARGLNLSNYANDLADDILTSARSARSETLRNTKHLAFARQWLDDAPAIGLYQSTVNSVVTRSVRGVDARDVIVSPDERYNSVLYWTVGDRTVYTTP
ncbi:MAG TPA: peptide ABC transporter substrate-binding protein [Candidatus Saccharibacteria bacterium]|nr:peptide ABC transporter substrate-binding protein [Candidatus Saccharibacteria bacterium]